MPHQARARPASDAGLTDGKSPVVSGPESLTKGAVMEKQDIPFLSASELSKLIASREVSPVEAAEAYLDRIGRVDQKKIGK